MTTASSVAGKRPARPAERAYRLQLPGSENAGLSRLRRRDTEQRETAPRGRTDAMDAETAALEGLYERMNKDMSFDSVSCWATTSLSRSCGKTFRGQGQGHRTNEPTGLKTQHGDIRRGKEQTNVNNTSETVELSDVGTPNLLVSLKEKAAVSLSAHNSATGSGHHVPLAPDRPQSVRVGNCASSTLTLSTGAPQGCVLSPLLYSLYTYDCTATSNSTIIVKFADDTGVMGLISDNDERAYLEEIKHLENNLLLNVSKTKELIVDCSKKQERHYQPVRISGTTVERVDFRYLGVHISQDLSWSRHTNSLAKKARQHLYHLRRLRDFRLPSKVLRNFYTCTIESILTGNITVWFENSTKQDTQALQRVVRSAECITHTELPDLQTIYYKRCQTKARRIVKDPTHPNNRLFSLLRSGKRFRSLKTKTERLKRSFFPQTIGALNQGN
ncbi:hypothetical protein P4O66_002282 [Electrophorus voltai]|uniref:Reverse transcriptase domain-containing protein n=1 Tax=Electrophorus voltai TaxID=2609070 RepID=A0AAD9DQ55_9TELE|nr:hypothetical protein P4O66_002282 [Electrophorus voltai]